MEILNSVFAKNLNYFMELRRMSQADLARALNVATSSVSYWCRGKKIPRSDMLAAICQVLRIEMNDLLLERNTEQTFEQRLWDNHGVLFRKIGELSEEDQKLVEAFVERLTDSGE